MLPCLAVAVPVEAELGELLTDADGGNGVELDPDPTADDEGGLVELGH